MQYNFGLCSLKIAEYIILLNPLSVHMYHFEITDHLLHQVLAYLFICFSYLVLEFFTWNFLHFSTYEITFWSVKTFVACVFCLCFHAPCVFMFLLFLCWRSMIYFVKKTVHTVAISLVSICFPMMWSWIWLCFGVHVPTICIQSTIYIMISSKRCDAKNQHF